MTSDPIKEESKLTYDDRRKVLVQEKTQTMNNTKPAVEKDGKVVEKEKHFSTVESSMKVTYTEAGIKLAHDSLVGTQKNVKLSIERTNQEITQLEEKIEKNDLPEMPEDLFQLKAKLEELSKYAGLEKDKADLKAKNENLKLIQEDLIGVEKDIKEIKDTIGTRLKL